MNPQTPAPRECTLLILEDGRILAQNVTPALARLLLALNPKDATLRQRANPLPKP